MYTGVYAVAAHVFAVRSRFLDVHTLCASWASDEQPTFTIEPTAEQIARERQEWEICAQRGVTAYQNPTEGTLEMLAVHRALAEQCAADDCLLFHGSAIAVDGQTYLFTAPSGTGKSTHTALWRERFGARAEMVDDDKPFLRITDEGVTVFGTPWNGKHRLGHNVARPLKAIILLERAAQNTIRPMDRREAFPLLVPQAYRSADRAGTMRTMALLDRLTAQVGLYRLGCNMQPQAAAVAFDGMNPKEERVCD